MKNRNEIVNIKVFLVSFSRESIKCAINVKNFMSLSEIYIPHLKFFFLRFDKLHIFDVRKTGINSHLSCRLYLMIFPSNKPRCQSNNNV